MTPEQFHFIWGLKRGDTFSLTDRIAIESAWKHNPSWRVRLWCPETPTGIQWLKLKSRVPVELGHIPDNHEFNGHHIQHHQHRADLQRHTLLYALGGMYLDLDTITLAPIPNHWRLYDTAIGIETHDGQVNGLCNAVMMSQQYSQFQWEWLTLWQNFCGDDWNEFSVRAPWLLSKVFPRLVLCVDREMLGHTYSEHMRYFEEENPLEKIVVAHLWRTGTKRILDNLTEKKLEESNSSYAQAAKEYL